MKRFLGKYGISILWAASGSAAITLIAVYGWHISQPITPGFPLSTRGNIAWTPRLLKATATPTTSPINVKTLRPKTTPTVLSASTNPLSGMKFYVGDRGLPVWQTLDRGGLSATDAALLHRIADFPQGSWIGDFSGDVQEEVNRVTTAAAAKAQVPLLVLYNIPQRDCGLYSAGGSNSPEEYRAWIRSVASGLNGRRAVIILEPDALAGYDCLNATDRQIRSQLIAESVDVLKKNRQAVVYVDAGNALWHPVATMASRLKAAGITRADGFALNVSNYITTTDSIAYGRSLSALVGGKHFVVDTSRNGRGPVGGDQWCNPRDRGLGLRPTTATGIDLVDALFWVKNPGESDGECGGGPAAGGWWTELALELVRNAAN